MRIRNLSWLLTVIVAIVAYPLGSFLLAMLPNTMQSARSFTIWGLGMGVAVSVVLILWFALAIVNGTLGVVIRSKGKSAAGSE